MYPSISPLLLLAIAICLGGSSCHDNGSRDERDAQNQSSVNGGNNRTGSGIVPTQQIQPRMHRR
ncbi:hypothetical protein ATI02_1516 [Pseudomonas baetica]|uniref:Secreted protein n=1 Tax=Pseudomonas baetica TaxID=674054 RepID=A0ABX4PUN1_9PSED|nr:hypothetical protein ATI02_1516 [Pseudomonas baetica]